MRIDAWRGLGGLELLGGTSLWALACAPPCYDDGALQGGGDCPAQSGSGSVSTSETETETETAGMEGTGESGVMTAGVTSDSSTTSGVMCPGLDAILTPDTRTFEFVLEQSVNMNNDLDGVSQYSAVLDALFDPAAGVVTLQPETRFGMLVFYGLQGGCPVTDSEAPTINAAVPLAGLMVANAPMGARAVPDSIAEAVVELDNDVAAGDKTLVLLLGNEPGSCAIQSPNNAVELAQTRADTVEAITAAFDAGYPTRVVSIGGNINEGFLQEAANAGIGQQPGDPDATFWVALDRPQLRMAAADITATSRGCEFAVQDPPLAEDQASSCEVVVNGSVVAYQDPDGWDRIDEQTIQLQGAACDSIQLGLATVSMNCVCDA